MPAFLITYDLRAPGRNYNDLHRLLGTTWHGQRVAESVWLANLTRPAPAIRNAIAALLDPNDRIVVIELRPNFDWAARHGLKGGIARLQSWSP